MGARSQRTAIGTKSGIAAEPRHAVDGFRPQLIPSFTSFYLVSHNVKSFQSRLFVSGIDYLLLPEAMIDLESHARVQMTMFEILRHHWETRWLTETTNTNLWYLEKPVYSTQIGVSRDDLDKKLDVS